MKFIDLDQHVQMELLVEAINCKSLLLFNPEPMDWGRFHSLRHRCQELWGEDYSNERFDEFCHNSDSIYSRITKIPRQVVGFILNQ